MVESSRARLLLSRRWVPIYVIAGVAIALVVGDNSRFADAQTPPAGYGNFTSAVSLWVEGGNVVVQANAAPDHKSPYFFPTSDPRWEAYNGTNPNWVQNPNHIAPQTIEFRIPANPQEAAAHAATPLGPIGVAVNGVPLFNQYAGPNQPLTNEINSFDQYDGHPQMTGMYHYHVEPYALTAVNGAESLIGYLLDGFPVYGPKENGVAVTGLDQYHGHFGTTADYPQGVYHYHVTAAAPYINGNGFYGTAGTVTYTLSASPTPAATVATSVGGTGEDPDPRDAPAQRTTASSRSNATRRGVLAGVALVAVLMGGGWYALRRRHDRS